MDTFFLELEGELRVKESVTKVRALTLKNTLLSGEVEVTIGGKVKLARRDIISYHTTAEIVGVGEWRRWGVICSICGGASSHQRMIQQYCVHLRDSFFFV